MLANTPVLLVLELIPISSQWHRVYSSVYVVMLANTPLVLELIPVFS